MARRSYPLVVAAMFAGALALTALYMRSCYRAGVSVLEQKMEQVEEVKQSIDDQMKETECKDKSNPLCWQRQYPDPFREMDIEEMFREH